MDSKTEIGGNHIAGADMMASPKLGPMYDFKIYFRRKLWRNKLRFSLKTLLAHAKIYRSK
jgi:hypothetical protein